ncbi:MAG: sodium-translocating pyrophosphatase [Candidatus Hecatellaceae archaeon]
MLPFIAVAAALGFAGYLVWSILKEEAGSGEVITIHEAIKVAAMAYLNRQYRTLLAFMVVVAVILGVAVKWQVGLSFIVGACFSAAAGYIGMTIAVRANARTATAAKHGVGKALRIAFKGGAVTGLLMVALALLGLSVFFLLWQDPILFAGFGFGGSIVALFARIGGGIYTKSADVGADLVGKVEAGIPEDDPRNPAVIADFVGDNVGDDAGMAADLFETYAVTMIGAMLLAVIPTVPAFKVVEGGASIYHWGKLIYPLLLGAIALLATIVGTFAVRAGGKTKPSTAILQGILVTSVISVIGFYFLTVWLSLPMGVFYASIVGVVVTVLLAVINNYYTSYAYRPTKSISEASQAGPAVNLITGLSVGLESSALPVAVIASSIPIAYFAAGGALSIIDGFYGVAVAVMAMLSIAGIIVSVDAFGPIVDNANGIAEMAGLGEDVRQGLDPLDALGNTTKSLTKAFAIGSAGLAALSLLFAYLVEVVRGSIELNPQAYSNLNFQQALMELTGKVTLMSPKVILGLFVGGVLVFLFASLCMRGVAKGAFSMVSEVRRQFREIKGLMEGKAKPDYARCVDISVRTALKSMALPGIIVIVPPVIIGFVVGWEALAGLLIGTTVTGLATAIFMATGGAAWDNAKKFIELGNYGGKGSPAHSAAVVGDTVGDPCKDTAGPAINPMIKAINMLSVILAPLFLLIILG